MTLNPGDRVLIEAVVTKDWPEGNCVCVNGGEWVARERVHPMPEAVWVARDNITHPDEMDRIGIFKEQPTYDAECEVFLGSYRAISVADFRYQFGDHNLPAPGTCRRVHLLYIDAEDET